MSDFYSLSKWAFLQERGTESVKFFHQPDLRARFSKSVELGPKRSVPDDEHTDLPESPPPNYQEHNTSTLPVLRQRLLNFPKP